jgi:hypothetical protein
LLRTRQPKERITMLKATQNAKIDPTFAVIDAHRQATATRYPILEKMGAIRDGTPERWAMEDAHEKWADIEKKATVKLRKIQPTTVGSDGVRRGAFGPLPRLRMDY